MSDADRLYLLLNEALVDRKPLVGLRRAHELLALAPRDIGYRWQGAWLAIDLNRPREALEFLGDVKEFDWPSVWPCAKHPSNFGFASKAHHLLGEYEAGLEVARFGLGFFPDSLTLRSLEVGALAALGRVAEVERVIREVLQGQAEDDFTPGQVILEASKELRVHGYAHQAPAFWACSLIEPPASSGVVATERKRIGARHASG